MRLAAIIVCASAAIAGCKFPYPEDVPDEDALAADASDEHIDASVDAPVNRRAIGGAVTGLWTGGVVALHLQAGSTTEDLLAAADQPFVFVNKIDDGATYVVTVVDDGPDHDCVIGNGSGRVMGADVDNLAVSCTNLIPHTISISIAAPFTFDPATTHYVVPVSLLQQSVAVTVTGPTLTAMSVAGLPVTSGQPSGRVDLGQGQTTIRVELTKGSLSRRYDLVFDRGVTPIVEALYARAFNGGAVDLFGAVASSTDYVAVGAQNEDSSNAIGSDDAAGEAGAVYVYRRSGQTWMYSQFLKGSPITSGRNFGAALDMDDNVLAVGAPFESAARGAIYVFRLDTSLGWWNEERRLTASDARDGDRFGYSVRGRGDVIVVGSPYRGSAANLADQSGGLYTFHRSGTSWIQEPVLRSPSPITNGWFGNGVAMDGDALAVLQPGDGKVFVYRRAGTSWVPEILPVGVTGSDIALDGDTLVVGAPQVGTAGAVRVFTRSGAIWAETAMLTDANPPSGARLSGAVIRDNVILASDGRTHGVLLFEKVGGAWVARPPVLVSQSSTGITFGGYFTISSNGAAIGAPSDGGPSPFVQRSGTVWMFR